MKITNDAGGWTLVFGKKDQHLFHFYNDWEQIFGKWNWLTFTVIRIEFERDYMAPGADFEFVILGLGFRIRWNDDWEATEEGRELLKRTKEIDEQFKQNENLDNNRHPLGTPKND